MVERLRSLALLLLIPALALAGCPEPCECDDDSAGDDDTTGDDDVAGDDDTVDPGLDLDGDGYSPDDGDCDDEDPAVFPGAEDICDDDVDQDCDGIPDKGCRIYISVGEFQMGADDDVGAADQKPQHAVSLDAYWIDKYEVTVGSYRQCEQDGHCEPPKEVSSFTRDHYYDDPDYDDYPVVWITREGARQYCAQAGGRLPTEAEWEKAARGDQDTRLYPWGDWFDCSQANVNWCVGDTSRIGSYPLNRSPYGVADMAGNVWEFFEDFYDPMYYSTSPYENPTGPANGENLSYRGGAFTWWGNPMVTLRHPARELSSRFLNVGFRCVYDD